MAGGDPGSGKGFSWEAESRLLPLLSHSLEPGKGLLARINVRAAAPLAGVTSTFLGRTHSPRTRCFRSGIPALVPAGTLSKEGVLVPAGNPGAGPAGFPGPLPSSSRLPSRCPPSRGRTSWGGGGGASDQVASCPDWEFHLHVTISFLPTVVTPFPEILGW